MKKYVHLLLIVSSFVYQTHAQELTLPMIEEGRTWHVVSLSPTEEPQQGFEGENFYRDLQGRPCIGIPYEFLLKGDTVMNGQIYKKLIRVTNGPLFYCGLRQEGNRVYRCEQEGTLEYVVFDFNLNPGDIFSIPYDDKNQMRVERLDLITVDGVERKILTMVPYGEIVKVYDFIVDIWIEGIGCLNGPNHPFWWTAIDSGQFLLLDCFQNGECLIAYDDYHVYLPSGINSTYYLKKNTDNSIPYDLQGRRLTGEPGKGIYIQNGRKMVAK